MMYPANVLACTFEAIRLTDALRAWRNTRSAAKCRKAFGINKREHREDHDVEILEYQTDALAHCMAGEP